tara:strand:+ start:172 stop:285 length:114 start_codon:yes stop_codon:yes gene_type:complete
VALAVVDKTDNALLLVAVFAAMIFRREKGYEVSGIIL